MIEKCKPKIKTYNALVVELRIALRECKEQIFAMHPLSCSTDDEISKQYVALCDSIANWEEIQFGELENPLGYFHHIKFSHESFRLVRAYLGGHKEIQTVDDYPAAGNLMLTYLVHLHLHQKILQDRIFFPSLHLTYERFISFIENDMRKNEPRRGQSFC